MLWHAMGNWTTARKERSNPMNTTHLDQFTRAYIKCALWSSTDEDGEPLDRNCDASDISEETRAQIIADCAKFQSENAENIGIDWEQAGHDFWLTRNGHGCGFWDGDWLEPQATRLTDAAHAFASFDLYIGDDGQIHGYPLTAVTPVTGGAK